MVLTDVNIGGELRQVLFSMNQRIKYCQLRKLSAMEMNIELLNPDNWDESVVRDLIYSALWAGCKAKKEAVNFDEFEVGTWIEEMPQDELNKVFQVLIDSNNTGEEEGDKKKVTEKTSPKKKLLATA